jgi:colanic acid biosynthesis glycosyl transferase WcaI
MGHILIISRYYLPEMTAGAVSVSETAERLVKLGHQVTVLTTVPNYPTGIVPPGYRGYRIQSEVREGVRVIRVWSYIAPNKGFARRILAQLSFGCVAPLLGWKEVGRPDVLIVSSPPLFNVIAGRLLAWLKHCSLIVRIADLWPESAVEFGVLHNRFLIRLAEWLEWSTYRRASFVWVVTEGIRNTLIQRGLSPERILLLTNGVDCTKFSPLPQAQARAELGWDDRFTILYAGNHGLAYGMATILDAAEQLRDCTDVHLVLVGDGVKKADLVAQAKRRDLKNVTFLDSVPHDRMPLLLAGADGCLIPLRNVPFLQGSLPVKMFEVMACARPMILGAEGIARQLAEREAGAAIYVEPENPMALSSAILYLRDHPDLAEKLGRRGRALVEARFDYDQLTATLDARVAALLEKKTPISSSIAPASASTTAEGSEA